MIFLLGKHFSFCPKTRTWRTWLVLAIRLNHMKCTAYLHRLSFVKVKCKTTDNNTRKQQVFINIKRQKHQKDDFICCRILLFCLLWPCTIWDYFQLLLDSFQQSQAEQWLDCRRYCQSCKTKLVYKLPLNFTPKVPLIEKASITYIHSTDMQAHRTCAAILKFI